MYRGPISSSSYDIPSASPPPKKTSTEALDGTWSWYSRRCSTWGWDVLVRETKETYYSVKRDLLLCQKRPITALQHVGLGRFGERDLLTL